jgi:hypothetical protein
VLAKVDGYSLHERRKLLGQHPALTARLFEKKMDGLWEKVFNGKDRPIGEVTDYWRRVEFQRRMVPHEHAIAFVASDHRTRKTPGSAHYDEDSPLPEDVKSDPEAAIRWCRRTITCNLLPRIPEDDSDIAGGESSDVVREREAQPDWIYADRKRYFNNWARYPCRAPFTCRPSSADEDQRDLDFRVGHDLRPVDHRVYVRTRRATLCSQMHMCTFTCRKYNAPGDFRCRFEGDRWNSAEHFHPEPIVYEDRDRRNRPRVRVLPARNNTHTNRGFVSPLVTAAREGANLDVQIVDNEHGAAVYSCQYIGKAEAPDEKVFQLCLCKKLAKLTSSGQLNSSTRMKAVAQTFISAVPVGSVQVR